MAEPPQLRINLDSDEEMELVDSPAPGPSQPAPRRQLQQVDPNDPRYFGTTSSSEESDEDEERTPPGSPSPSRPPRQQLQVLDPAELDDYVNVTSTSSEEEEKEDEGSSDSGSQATTQQMTSEEEDVEEIDRDAPPVICISDDEDPFNPAEAGPFEATERGYTWVEQVVTVKVKQRTLTRGRQVVHQSEWERIDIQAETKKLTPPGQPCEEVPSQSTEPRSPEPETPQYSPLRRPHPRPRPAATPRPALLALLPAAQEPMDTSEQPGPSSAAPADDEGGSRPFDDEDWREWNRTKEAEKRWDEERKKREAEEMKKKEEEEKSRGEGRRQTRRKTGSRPGTSSQEVRSMEVGSEEESGSETNRWWKESSRQQPDQVILGQRGATPKRKRPNRSIPRFEKPSLKPSQGTGDKPAAHQQPPVTKPSGRGKGPSQTSTGPSSDPKQKRKPTVKSTVKKLPKKTTPAP